MSQKKAAEEKLQKGTANLIEKLMPALFAPVSMQQAVTVRDIKAKGPTWISRCTLNKPNVTTGLEEVVSNAIKKLAPGLKPPKETTVENVEIQWTAVRHGVGDKEPEPSVSEKEKYAGIMKDVKSQSVVLYAHGGFYYTGSAASVRPITQALSQETGGRCVSPNYRLAPQNPFPSALVDLLLTYISLLSPAEGAFHSAVPAHDIVLAGESGGGNLVFSLLVLLQYIRDHNNGGVYFGDKWVEVPFPAGIASLSPHCDHTSSSDSNTRNKPYDIFILDVLPYLQPTFPTCDAWPTRPPREDMYCDAPTLLHPLVSVAIAPTWSSAGLPPMFIACGQELLADEAYYVAKKVADSGNIVQFSHYDALPHSFVSYFPRIPQSKHVLQRWGSFCREAIENAQGLKSEWVRYTADDMEFKGAELDLPPPLDESTVKRRMVEAVAKRKPWTGRPSGSSL